MTFENIIFDFDGVILESHKIKNRAFHQLFLPYGKKIAKMTHEYHLRNLGKSRFIKFRYIIKKILNQNVTKEKLNSLSVKFNKLSFEKICNLKISNSLLNYFKTINKNTNLYISTGTPQKLIEKILKKKKIYKYFKKVYGSPLTKIQHINQIKKNKKKTIFIGDSYEDFISCKKTKVKVILKKHKENKKTFINKRVIKIKNFRNFNFFLTSLKN